jgi:hypothetical protein
VSLSETAGRAIVYERSQRRCEVCGRPAASVHHRMKEGRPWDPANLLSLCGDGVAYCHGWIEAHPTHAQALGLWLPRGADYTAWPAWLHPTMWWRGWWFLDNDGCWRWDPARSLHPSPPADVTAAIRALVLDRRIELSAPLMQ